MTEADMLPSRAVVSIAPVMELAGKVPDMLAAGKSP
jgi:hypothetical protein